MIEYTKDSDGSVYAYERTPRSQGLAKNRIENSGHEQITETEVKVLIAPTEEQQAEADESAAKAEIATVESTPRLLREALIDNAQLLTLREGVLEQLQAEEATIEPLRDDLAKAIGRRKAFAARRKRPARQQEKNG